jgi:hypothetical protein
VFAARWHHVKPSFDNELSKIDYDGCVIRHNRGHEQDDSLSELSDAYGPLEMSNSGSTVAIEATMSALLANLDRSLPGIKSSRAVEAIAALIR